jgi:hypothetical protein
MDALRSSLATFGQRKAIVIWRRPAEGGDVVGAGEMIVLCGNGTYRAACELGWDSIAATEFEGNEIQARAYAIVDNRSSELSTWHPERLAFQSEIIGQHWDVGAVGGIEWSALVPTFAVEPPPKKEKTPRAERSAPNVVDAEISRRASESATIDVEVAAEPSNRIEAFDLLPENEIHFDPDPDNGMLLIASDSSGRKCFSVQVEPSFMPTVVLRWERRTGKRVEDGR